MSTRVIYMRAAKAKFCPMEKNRFCQGDNCMAWRFVDPYIVRRTFIADNPTALVDPGRPAAVPDDWVFEPYVPEDGEPACWVEPEQEARMSADGYCAMVPA